MKKKNRLIYLSLFLALFFTITAGGQLWAATVTYNSTSGNWSEASKWTVSPGGSHRVPTVTDDVVIPTGSTVTIDGNYTVTGLTIAGTGVLKPPTTGTRTLTVKGSITTTGAADYQNLYGANSLGTLNISMTNTSSKSITATAGNIVFNNFTITNGSTVTSASSYELYGNLTVEGTGSITHSSGTVTVTGSSSVLTKSTLGTLTLNSLLISADATNVTSASDFTVSEYFALETGGRFTASSGSITLSNAGGGVIPTPVNPNAEGDLQFYHLTLSPSSTTVSPATSFTIAGKLAKTGNGDFAPSAGTVVFDNNASINVPKTILNTGTGDLKFFNLKVTDRSHVKNISASSTSITMDGGATGGNSLTVEGSGSFKDSTGTMVFSETSATNPVRIVCSSSGILELFNVVVADDANTNMTSSTNFTIRGDFTNSENSAFLATSPSVITFNNLGGKIISNENTTSVGTMKFNSIKLTDNLGVTSVVTPSSSSYNCFEMTGDFTVLGQSSFIAGTSSTITFSGSTPKTITNQGTLNFYDLIISTGSQVNTTSDFTVVNQITTGASASSGALRADGKSIVTFELTGDPFLGTTATALEFQSLRFTGAATAALNANNLRVKGDIIFDGTGSIYFSDNPGTISFVGSSQQAIRGSSTSTSFTFSNMTVNNPLGVRLEKSIYLGESGTSATITLTSGDIDLYGTHNIYFGDPDCALIGERSSGVSTGNVVRNSVSGYGYIQTASTCAAANINASGIGLAGLTDGTADKQIRRYHRARNLNGSYGVSRYWEVVAGTYSGGTLEFQYDESDLNGNTETYLSLYYTSVSNAETTEMSYGDGTAGWDEWSGTASEDYDEVTRASSTFTTSTFYTVAERTLTIANLPNTSIHADLKMATSPLTAGTTGKIILGFQATSSATISSMSALVLHTNTNSVGSLKNFVLKVTNDITSSSLSTITTGSVDGKTITFAFSTSSQTFTPGETKYFFVTADVEQTVTAGTPTIYAYFTQDDVTITTTKVNTITITGQSYSFTPLTIELSSGNAPPAGPLELARSDQEIYGFKLIPTANSSASFSSVNITVTLGNGAENDDFTNFSLVLDENKNGIVDGSESAFTTIASLPAITGILTFTIPAANQALTAGEENHYLVVASVASDAVVNGTIKLKIQSHADVAVASPATIPDGGPYQGNLMSVRGGGAPVKLSVTVFSLSALDATNSDKGDNEVVTGENICLRVQAQDADGYAQKVTLSTSIQITVIAGSSVPAITYTVPTINASESTTTINDLVLTFATGATDVALKVAVIPGGDALEADTVSGITVFAAQPTIHTSGMTVASISSSSASLTWDASTPGSSGTYRIIVAKANGWPTAPTDGIDYTESSNFSSPGTPNGTTGTGSVVVYDGSGTDVNITGLTPSTKYYFVSYEYNGTGGATNYNTLTTYTGEANPNSDKVSANTLAASPTAKSTLLTFTSVQPYQMKLTWTKPPIGGGAYSLVVGRLGIAPATSPVDTTVYTANASFGTVGTELGNSVIVYNGDGNTVTVTNLKADTTYYYRIYEYNGTGNKINYLTTQFLSGYRSTLAEEPTIQAHTINFSDMTLGANTSIKVNWVRGNGTHCILVGKAGSNVTVAETPSDQTAAYTHTATSVQFGTTTALGNGYVLYKGTGNTLTVSGLQYGQTYYFKVYEYNAGKGANTTVDNSTINYLTSSSTDNPNYRIADSYEPNDQLSDAKFINSAGTLYNGIISSATDADWFSFRPDFENLYDNVRIRMTGLPKNYTIEVYRSDGRLLRRSKRISTNDEILVINNLPEDDYYIKIYSAEGDYSLIPYRVFVLNRVLVYMSDTQ
ncbi:MAG: type sorting protein [Bacteroidota bacterium]|nr:type sorting protein [Bacteroidota bacterium]